MDAHLGKVILFIHQQEGFGAHLVTVFSLGKNELFKQMNNPEGSWL
jgi:2-acylglycerol O-acyltransferase 1